MLVSHVHPYCMSSPDGTGADAPSTARQFDGNLQSILVTHYRQKVVQLVCFVLFFLWPGYGFPHAVLG